MRLAFISHDSTFFVMRNKFFTATSHSSNNKPYRHLAKEQHQGWVSVRLIYCGICEIILFCFCQHTFALRLLSTGCLWNIYSWGVKSSVWYKPCLYYIKWQDFLYHSEGHINAHRFRHSFLPSFLSTPSRSAFSRLSNSWRGGEHSRMCGRWTSCLCN